MNGFISIEVAKYEIVFQVLATILLLVILYKFTFKSFNEYLKKRKDFVNDSIEKTQQNEIKANQTKTQIEEELKQIKNSKEQILEKAQNRATAKEEEIINAAKKQAAQLLQKNQEELKMDKLKVQQELSSELLNISTVVAEKFLQEKITEQEDLKMIKEAIQKVDYE